MRPCKNSTPITEWSNKQLEAELKKTDITTKDTQKINNILSTRKQKGVELAEKFFNTRINKFLSLAQWQLYREGKARVYGVGKQARFYIEDMSMLMDKMVEIRSKFDKHNTNTTQEVNTWKR